MTNLQAINAMLTWLSWLQVARTAQAVWKRDQQTNPGDSAEREITG
jgi:hypothetical protein